MAIDAKYGRVTLEHGTIGEDEPVVVFRAKDMNLPKVLMYYRLLCGRNGSPRRHLALVGKSHELVLKWQEEHGSRIPNSESSRKWLEE